MAASLPAPLLKTSPKIGFAPSAAQAKMRLKWWKTDSPPHAKRKIPFRQQNSEGDFLEGVSKCTFWLHPRRCVRMAKMQGDEDEGAGSVLKYMTKPESDSNEADWLL